MQQKIINTLLVFVSISALLIVWNNLDSDVPIKKTELKIPIEFEQFYQSFHEDSTTQMDHIVFPLKGITFDENGTPHDTIWTKENWKIHEDPRNFSKSFKVTYKKLGSMIIETTTHKTYPFSMERRFSKNENGYEMIYYKQMGPS